MSLLTPTNSLVNNLMANGEQVTPEIGMGATMLMWTDRRPFTIIQLKTRKHLLCEIDVQEDDYVRTDKNGTSEDQKYQFTRNPNGVTYTLTLRKNGRWVVKGQGLKNGQAFAIGYRDRYEDPCF